MSPLFAHAPSYWPRSHQNLLQMSPPGSENDPQIPLWETLGPKNGPKCPKTCPQGAPASHKVRPGGPKGAQRCPKEAQRAPKRDPKASPKAPQKAPKNGPRTRGPYFLKTELSPAREPSPGNPPASCQRPVRQNPEPPSPRPPPHVNKELYR